MTYTDSRGHQNIIRVSTLVATMINMVSISYPSLPFWGPTTRHIETSQAEHVLMYMVFPLTFCCMELYN